MTIGEKIKHLREINEMSLEDLAQKTGVNRTTIMRYEKGNTEKFPTSQVVPFATALHTTPEYLMGWEEQKASEPESTDAVKDVIEQFNQLDAASRDKVLAEIIKTLSSH